MNIEKVKQTKNGFKLNGAWDVPNQAGNSDYDAIQKWIAAGGVVEPEFTTEELLQNAKDSKTTLCKVFLHSTDWYCLKEIDEPDSYPQEIKDQRIAARLAINLTENATTIAEVEAVT